MALYREMDSLIKITGSKKRYESKSKGKIVKVPLYPKESVYHVQLVRKEIAAVLQKAARITIIPPCKVNKGGDVYTLRIALYQRAMDRLVQKLGMWMY